MVDDHDADEALGVRPPIAQFGVYHRRSVLVDVVVVLGSRVLVAGDLLEAPVQEGGVEVPSFVAENAVEPLDD